MRLSEKHVKGANPCFRQLGQKRKSDVSSLAVSEIETSPSSANSQSQFQVSLKSVPDVRIKKSAVLSDEDEIPRPSRSKGKATVRADSDTERDLKAMMEVDDGISTHANTHADPNLPCKDQVVRVSRPPMNKPKEEEPVTDQEDAAISDPKETIYKKTKKKKGKKTIPTGRNGLPKRRVVKSRSIQDEKGYMGQSS
jgi:DNA polymerase delta subunit 3